jgi:hypothetical protein
MCWRVKSESKSKKKAAGAIKDAADEKSGGLV